MSPTPWHGQRRPGLLALVLLAHGLALLGWQRTMVPARLPVAPAVSPSSLVWLRLLPPVTAIANKTPAAPTAPSKPVSPTLPDRGQRVAHRHETQGIAVTTEPAPKQPERPRAVAAELPASAASAPLRRLLDTDATRRAISAAAQAPLLSERADAATGASPRSGAQRLSDAEAAALKGDCAKGGYAGGGMGLLSLPFLAYAAATGACAR